MSGFALSPAVRLAPKAANALFASDGSREAANRIIERHRLPNKTLDLVGVASELKALAKTNPRLAQNTFAEINGRLKPVRQGELQRLVGNGLANPNKQAERSAQGQTVLKAVSSSSDALHGAAAIGVESKALQKFVPLPAKILFATVDGKLKYDELRAKGFSHGAAWAGVGAGQASGLGISAVGSGIGSVAGGVIGGLATAPTGPGAIAGAAGGSAAGGVIGGTIAGGIDWITGASDKAALAAANHFDGKSIK